MDKQHTEAKNGTFGSRFTGVFRLCFLFGMVGLSGAALVFALSIPYKGIG